MSVLLQPNDSIHFWDRQNSKIVFLFKKRTGGNNRSMLLYLVAHGSWSMHGWQNILLQRGMNTIRRQVQGAFFPWLHIFLFSFLYACPWAGVYYHILRLPFLQNVHEGTTRKQTSNGMVRIREGTDWWGTHSRSLTYCSGTWCVVLLLMVHLLVVYAWLEHPACFARTIILSSITVNYLLNNY